MSSLFFFLSLSLLTLDQAALISHISFSVGNFLAFESHPCFTMAKSIRASVSKRNRATLRKNFFGPIVDARTERLHAKLQELADKPRPEAPEKSKREQAEDEAAKAQLGGDEAMDVDSKAPKSAKKVGRVQKRNQKPRNSIVFKKRQPSGKRGTKK
ncbi:unnamed protein product [Penicillium olsonii]|uniref:DUF2423 domain-containing protein n=1 Tax=Penicillium olsonii TaxID=99116 RepID=A0A9W4HT55_PENOL|nr:unnamed protein product [Penicillium olsonii]CAG8236759.1 unnamed protein product [Penicillium olsonii]